MVLGPRYVLPEIEVLPLQPDPAYSLRQQPVLSIGAGRAILFVLEIECFQIQFVSGAIYERATSG
jgi:hypothetical protein